MKRTIAVGLATVAMLVGATVFASGSGETAEEPVVDEIEIMWQQEVTEEFWNPVISAYETEDGAAPINFNLSPKAYEQIRFRLTSGDAPDVFFTWASEFDFFGAIEDDMLYPVDDVLAAETHDGEETIGDALFDEGLELGNVEGKHYLLPVGKLLASMYYDQLFFEENGYDVPTTREEFLALGDAVRNDHDIPLIVYAGAYPFMLSDAIIWPVIANIDPDAVEALNNNEPDAWTADAVVEALSFVEEMAARGHISRDSVAMDHIESQIEFINHNSAIVPSGTWLEGEMADQWPDEFALAPLTAPEVDGSRSMMAISEAMVLPRTENIEAKLPHLIRLIRLFYSESIATENMRKADYVMAFDTVPDAVMQELPDSVPATWEIASNDDVRVLSPEYRFKYKEVFIEYNDLLNALVLGDVTAREMAEQMETVATEHR